MSYGYDTFTTRALSDAAEAARDLRRRGGVRQSYGIGPDRRLTAAEKRDLAIIERAVKRLFAEDTKHR